MSARWTVTLMALTIAAALPERAYSQERLDAATETLGPVEPGTMFVRLTNTYTVVEIRKPSAGQPMMTVVSRGAARQSRTTRIASETWSAVIGAARRAFAAREPRLAARAEAVKRYREDTAAGRPALPPEIITQRDLACLGPVTLTLSDEKGVVTADICPEPEFDAFRAYLVRDLALAHLTACEGIPEGPYPLRLCVELAGRRDFAAEWLTWADERGLLRGIYRGEGLRSYDGFTAAGAQFRAVDRQGRARGDWQMLNNVLPELSGLVLSPVEYRGTDRGDVEIRGRAHDREGRAAPYLQTWSRDGPRWRIARFELGQLQKATQVSDPLQIFPVSLR